MGEYAKFNGHEIKIGTCEDMYYLRADQRHRVDPLSGNVNPRGSDALGLRFRFPFPDEDNIQPGGFEDYNRGERIYGFPMPGKTEDHYKVQFRATNGYLVCLPCPESGDKTLEGIGIKIGKNGYGGSLRLRQQKLLADGRLVPVVSCGGCGAAWRVEEPHEIEALAVCFRSMADQQSAVMSSKYLNAIADRILAGANIQPAQEVSR